MRAVQVHGIELIDLVVVNLYPFQETIARPDVTDELAIEMIDIGGPAMLRSAAKNHEFVLPVIDPADYDRVLIALEQNQVTPVLRRELAAKVFAATSRYDALVADYLAGKTKAAEQEAKAQNGLQARDWPGVLHITAFPRWRCVTAKIRIRRLTFTWSQARPRRPSRVPSSFRARSYRTTTFRTPMRRSRCCARLTTLNSLLQSRSNT
ncbi:hypothetical protein GCM10025858_22350 [Alicyclobacillus sacchari]|nr:hypothetical protein GCM10025858_22350 [Alicyclobacillus sacchari]